MQGSIIYAGVVLLANLRILSSQHLYHPLGLFIMGSQIANYFVLYWLESLNENIH